MRDDIAKVIVEKPRGGRGRATTSKQRRRHWSKLDAPTKIGMKKDTPSHKYFSDHLAPLKGFFKKNIGRPWDKAYAEVCERLKGRSTMEQHVLDHVKRDIVERDCRFDENGFPHRPYRYYSAGLPLGKGELYVDRNGIIAIVKDDWKYRNAHEVAGSYWTRKPEKTIEVPGGKKFTWNNGMWAPVDPNFDKDGVHYYMQNGIWFKTLVGQTVTDSRRKYDIKGNETVEYFTYQITKDVQLGSDEMRRLKLKNIVEEPVIAKRSQKKDRDPDWFKKNP